MTNLISRMIGASRLDSRTYEDVEADVGSTAPAIFIVLVASVAAALGAGVRDIAGIVGSVVVFVATWGFWVGLTYMIGTRLLPAAETHSSIGEVLRTTGFSASPGILRIFGFLPFIGLPIMIVVTFWMLLTFVVAIRHAMDYTSSLRALAVCALGWLIHGIFLFAFVRSAI